MDRIEVINAVDNIETLARLDSDVLQYLDEETRRRKIDVEVLITEIISNYAHERIPNKE